MLQRILAIALSICLTIEALPLQAIAQTMPQDTQPQTAVFAEDVPDPEETEPETTTPEQTIPETTVPNETEPETTVPEETVPETTVPEETVPETTIPEETVPEFTIPEETVPLESTEETIPEETVEDVVELDAAEYMGFAYQIKSSSDGERYVSITKYVGESTEVEVPEEIEGLPVRVIESGAFASATELRSIVIPSGVTEIADGKNSTLGVFYNCTSLVHVILPDSLTYIGDYGFYGCTSLDNIYLPNSLEKLGNYVFKNCSMLESISLSNSLKRFDASILSGTNVTHLELPDSVTVVSLNGISNQLTFLRWTAGIPIISRSQFQGMANLETVILPEGVTEISDGEDEFWSTGFNSGVYKYGAFRFDTALKSIILPNTLTKIGNYAFFGCTGLIDIQWGTNITSIGEYAFSGCTRLRKILIPDSITSIESWAFQNCTGINTVKLPDSLITIKSYAFYGCSSIAEISLPQGLKSVGDSAFYGTSITQLTLPDSVTQVSLSGIANQLTYLRWTAGIPLIGHSRFQGMNMLETIILPEGVTEIADGQDEIVSTGFNSYVNKYGAFRFDTALKTVVLPKSLTKIGDYAFDGCTSLQSITIGENITQLGAFAFNNCNNLNTIHWNEGVKSIGRCSFSDCTQLSQLELPNTIETIEACAFYGCTNITSIKLPSSLKKIEYAAFSNCKKISAIEFPEGLERLGDAFSGTAITRIELPDSITSVNLSGIANKLTYLRWTAGIPVIGRSCFQEMNMLETIILPEGVTEIADGKDEIVSTGFNSYVDKYGAFRFDTALKTVVLPKSLTKIGDYAFDGCTSLTELKLPQKLETIGSNALRNTKLTKLELPDTVTSVSLSGLSETLTYIRWPAGIDAVPTYQFQNYKALETVVLPVTLSKIGAYAFDGCTNLKRVRLGIETNIIGSNAFRNCKNMTLEVWPGSYGEQYAEENGLPYIYAGKAGTVEVTLDPDIYQGLELTLRLGNTLLTQAVTGKTVYRFSGLDEDVVGVLQVKNSYGEVLQQEDIPALSGTLSIALAGVTERGGITVKLVDETGKNITDQADITWYTRSGKHYADGPRLTGLPLGKELTGRVRLNGSYGKTHYAPADFSHTITAGENTVTLTLQRIPNITLSGKVLAGDTPLAGASVTVVREINGIHALRTTGITDAEGCFQLNIPAVEGQVLLRAYGYRDQQLPLDKAEQDLQLGSLALEPIDGARIRINAVVLGCVLPGEAATETALTDLDDWEFTVYNRTQQAQVQQVLPQGTTLILADTATPGDELELTVRSRSGDIQPTQATVTVGSDNCADLDLRLTSLGRIRMTFSESENPSVQALVYGPDGNLCWSGTCESGQAETAPLTDGSYTLVLMGQSTLLIPPRALADFEAAGLAEGTDYVSKQVTLSAGSICLCSFEQVPTLIESRFSYVDPDRSSFIASRTSLTAGKFFSLRAESAFADKYKGQISDIKWVFVLSEQTEFYEGTLTVSGAPDAPYIHDKGILTVSVEDPGQVVRFCVTATGQGEAVTSAYLEFSYDGRTIRQCVGNATVKINELDFVVTEKTLSTNLTVSGTASGNAEILVYDNDVLVCQTQAKSNGAWTASFELYQPGIYSSHRIYAVMVMATGNRIRSKTHTVIYQYTQEPVTVGTVELYLGNRSTPAAVFDFQKAEPGTVSYSVASNPSMTFLIRFASGDISQLSDVCLELDLSDGGTRSLKAVYDEVRGCFVTSGAFKTSALPIGLGVTYAYNGELVLNGEYQASVKAKIEQAKKDYEEIKINFIDNSFPPLKRLTLPDSITDVPENISDAVDQYNRELASLTDSTEHLNELSNNLFGTITADDGKITSEGKYGRITLESVSSGQMTAQELQNNGYAYQGDTGAGGCWTRSSWSNENTVEIITGPVPQSNAPATVSGLKMTYPSSANQEALLQEASEFFVAASNAYEAVSSLSETLDRITGYVDTFHPELNNTQWVQDLNRSSKVLSKLCTIAGITIDAMSINNDIQTFGALGNMFATTKDKSIKELQGLILLRILSNSVSCLGGLVALVGFMPVLTVPGSITMFAMGLISSYFNDLVDKQISDQLNRIQQKYGTGGTVKPIIDPSGYIYEAVPSNRLENVKVTCYQKVTKYDIYDDPYEEVMVWDASDTNQENPLYTDAEGIYAWDVPVGLWQVRAELPGYEAAVSNWLPVPPPQMDINLGLVSYEAPTLAEVYAQPDYVELTFSKYLRIETLPEKGICVYVGDQAITGTLTAVDAEAAPTDGEMLACKVRFLPQTSLEEGAVVTVVTGSTLLSYAGVKAVEATETAQVQRVVRSINAPQSIALPYRGTTAVTIQAQPFANAAGKTVFVQSASEMLLQIQEQSVVLDENGCAVVHLTGSLPGGTELYFRMENGLQAVTQVDIRIPAETASGNWKLSQKYLALQVGQSITLKSEGDVFWQLAEGSEKVAIVNADGTVIALTPGTAEVIATVYTAEGPISDTCRLEVVEALKPEKIQLSTQAVTSELFSTAYTSLDILLLWPQDSLTDTTAFLREENASFSSAIQTPHFTDPTMASLFDVVPTDDRHIEIHPSQYAVEHPEAVAKKYVSTITLTVDGVEYTTDPLTLTVKKTTPKLKATVASFNSFYSGQSQDIHVTGGTVTRVERSSTPLPSWLKLDGTRLVLTEPVRNISAKVCLKIFTEQWRIPTEVTVSVKSSYTAPSLTLSASSITFSQQIDHSSGIKLTLKGRKKQNTLTDLNVSGITAPQGYTVSNFNVLDGSFVLNPQHGATAGKIMLGVTFRDTSEVLSLPVNVKLAPVNLALSQKKVVLNTLGADNTLVTVTASPADYMLTQPEWRVTSKAGTDALATGELAVSWESGALRIGTTNETPASAQYTLYVKVSGSKESSLQISTVNKVPSASVKLQGSIDLSFPDRPALATVSFQNCGGTLGTYSYTVAEKKGKQLLNPNVTEYFSVTREAANQIAIRCVDETHVDPRNTYVLTLELTLPDGNVLSKSISLKVMRTPVRMKLSSSTLTLNSAVGDQAAIAFSCATKGYPLAAPLLQLMDKSCKNSADGQLTVQVNQNTLSISTNDATLPGTSYKLLVKANSYAPASTLTINISAKNKSQITGNLKLTGKLDVIRDGSGITAVPSYRGCVNAPRSEALEIYSSADGYQRPITDLFRVTANGAGGYTIARAPGKQIDHTLKYRVKLVTTFPGTSEAPIVVTSKFQNLSIMMGSAKLTAKAARSSLFIQDPNDWLSFSIYSEDLALSKAIRAKVSNTNLFTVLDSSAGEFRLGLNPSANFSKVIGKTQTITVKVWLEGNLSTKPNGEVKLKVLLR